MTPEQLWTRYSAIWSQGDAGIRTAELAACLTEEAGYCDPNGLIAGPAALSDYMAGFQQSVPPGARFQMRGLAHHNGRTLAHWDLLGPQGEVMQKGASFGALSPDGRLSAITGFFPLPDAQ